jgi:hypothetical protein
LGIAVVHDDTIGSAVLTRVPGADDRITAGLEPFFQALSLADQDRMESSFADWRDQWLTEFAALSADERQGSA